MSGEDLRRILRAIIFLFVTLFILYWGMLPGDFSMPGAQISPILFAWSAAFIIRRPGSVGVVVILIASFLYMIFNDEGVALGALAFLLFSLFIHEVRDYLEHQSFIFETIAMTLSYLVIQILKNLVLQLFFTQHFNLLTILEFSLYFMVSYAIFAAIIRFVVGRRASKKAS